MEIYAVDPTGKAPIVQLTFGTESDCAYPYPLPAGYVDPLPSPDGRHVLYRCASGGREASLWVAGADGRAPRRLVAPQTDLSPAQGTTAAAWSPDSKRIAYSAEDGLHVVRADGRGDRLVSSAGGRLAWSPDGKSLAVLWGTGLYLVHGGQTKLVRKDAGLDLAWSPNGRWIATWYHHDGFDIRLTSSAGASGPNVGQGVAAAWSPDGRRLAFEAPDGMYTVELATGRTRLLTRDTAYGHRDYDERALGLDWSPDGRSIAYVAGSIDPDDGVQSGDLRTVTLDGRTRTVVSADRRHGGRIVSFAWTRPPVHTRYRSAQAAPATRVAPRDLLAQGPISMLAADGRRVAFVSCMGVYTWTPATGEVSELTRRTWYEHLPASCFAPTSSWYFYSLALAGDRVAWAELVGCNSKTLTVGLEALPPMRASATLEQGHGSCGGPYAPGLGELTGSGDLLVFSTWEEKVDRTLRPGQDTFVTTNQEVRRVESGGCPCPVIGSSAGPFAPVDVNAGRLVVVGEKETRILDAAGKQVLSIPVSPEAAQLSGPDLVLLSGRELRDYDATSGELRHAWSLPDVPSGAECDLRCGGTYRLVVEDAAQGLLAYILDGRVHVLRLADGADKVLAAGTRARFMDAGLVYADGSRLHLVPFDRLPSSTPSRG